MSVDRQRDDFDQLHLLQKQLAAAQAEEAEALSALSKFTRRGGKNEAEFVALRDAASEARARTNDLIKKWQKLVRKLTND